MTDYSDKDDILLRRWCVERAIEHCNAVGALDVKQVMNDIYDFVTGGDGLSEAVSGDELPDNQLSNAADLWPHYKPFIRRVSGKISETTSVPADGIKVGGPIFMGGIDGHEFNPPHDFKTSSKISGDRQTATIPAQAGGGAMSEEAPSFREGGSCVSGDGADPAQGDGLPEPCRDADGKRPEPDVTGDREGVSDPEGAAEQPATEQGRHTGAGSARGGQILEDAHKNRTSKSHPDGVVKLAPLQEQVLTTICALHDRGAYATTLTVIAKDMDTITQNIRQAIKALIDKGFIEKDGKAQGALYLPLMRRDGTEYQEPCS